MKLKWIFPAIIIGFLIACNLLSRPVKTVMPAIPTTPASPAVSAAELNYAVSACNEKIKMDNTNLVTITSNGSQVLVEQDAGYVCCAKIGMELKQAGSLLKIIETNTGDMCKCICGYHVSAQISGLAPGSYHVQVWGIQFIDVQELKLLGEGVVTITTQTTSNKPVISTALPDLMVENGYYSVRYFGCPWGDPGEVRGWVKNIGEGNAGPFEVEINSGTTTLPGLESGVGVWASVPFASGPVGGVNINVDPNHKLQETNKSNNQYNILFTPPPTCTTATPGFEVTPSVTSTAIPVQTLTFTVAAAERWNMLEIEIHRGDTVHIKYMSGKWTYSPQVAPLDANGVATTAACGSTKPGARCAEPLPYAPDGALIATYDNPAYFLVGNESTFIAAQDGFLNLKMNAAEDEKTLQDRSGEISVEITIKK
jgi:hypothetical protein